VSSTSKATRTSSTEFPLPSSKPAAAVAEEDRALAARFLGGQLAVLDPIVGVRLAVVRRSRLPLPVELFLVGEDAGSAFLRIDPDRVLGAQGATRDLVGAFLVLADVQVAALDLDPFARQPDDPLDEVLGVVEGELEDQHVVALHRREGVEVLRHHDAVAARVVGVERNVVVPEGAGAAAVVPAQVPEERRLHRARRDLEDLDAEAADHQRHDEGDDDGLDVLLEPDPERVRLPLGLPGLAGAARRAERDEQHPEDDRGGEENRSEARVEHAQDEADQGRPDDVLAEDVAPALAQEDAQRRQQRAAHQDQGEDHPDAAAFRSARTRPTTGTAWSRSRSEAAASGRLPLKKTSRGVESGEIFGPAGAGAGAGAGSLIRRRPPT
jgi:hypothetical protein